MAGNAGRPARDRALGSRRAPKILLFDIDGTLVRAGGAGRKALDEAARRLYGKERVCSGLSLAGRGGADFAGTGLTGSESEGGSAGRWRSQSS